MSDLTRAYVAALEAGDELNLLAFGGFIACLAPIRYPTDSDKLRRFLDLPPAVPSNFPVYAYSTDLGAARQLADACTIGYGPSDSALTITKAVVYKGMDRAGIDVAAS